MPACGVKSIDRPPYQIDTRLVTNCLEINIHQQAPTVAISKSINIFKKYSFFFKTGTFPGTGHQKRGHLVTQASDTMITSLACPPPNTLLWCAALQVPEKKLKMVMADKELYKVCGVEVKRQIWQDNQALFGDEVSPLLKQYIVEKEGALFSSELSVLHNFFSPSPKTRRQGEVGPSTIKRHHSCQYWDFKKGTFSRAPPRPGPCHHPYHYPHTSYI